MVGISACAGGSFDTASTATDAATDVSTSTAAATDAATRLDSMPRFIRTSRGATPELAESTVTGTFVRLLRLLLLVWVFLKEITDFERITNQDVELVRKIKT